MGQNVLNVFFGTQRRVVFWLVVVAVLLAGTFQQEAEALIARLGRSLHMAIETLGPPVAVIVIGVWLAKKVIRGGGGK